MTIWSCLHLEMSDTEIGTTEEVEKKKKKGGVELLVTKERQELFSSIS